jgi:tRNA-splicing ligase RtcB
MGTLGSGNHFIEVCQSEQSGGYWLVVHSGSRCVGGAVSSYWQSKASENVEGEYIQDSLEEWMWEYVKFDFDTDLSEIRQWVFGGKGESFYDMEKIREDFNGEEIEERRRQIISVIPDEDRTEELDYLEGEDREGYITDMIFAQQYALENRNQMLLNICDALGIDVIEIIDSIHNYIDFEDRIIRKGATKARSQRKLIIPFNMSEGAVICRGEDNVEFNYSAPHGAGRRGSRRWAYDEFDTEQFDDLMDGITNTNDKNEILDEIPNAYKDSEDILDYLPQTASVIDTLNPVLNIKGE